MERSLPKIIFTGGHHNSALSVAKELVARNVAEVVWFGHKYSMLGDKNPSAEYKEVTEAGIRFREIIAGKVYRTWNVVHLMRLPFGFFQSYWYLMQERPRLVVSFGGYLAAPVVLAAWFQGIPAVTHEQTTVVGLSNRFISHFVKKIFITWPQSKQYFPEEKVTMIGLPLRKSIFEPKTAEKLFDNDLPVIYVTGGKQGSHVLNMSLAEALPELLSKVNIIHQCGSTSVFDDYERLAEKKKRLSPALRPRYKLHKYIFEDQIGDVFSQADLVVSRAGAHTVYEIAALGKPALFVPIPWVSHNEQYKNARILVNDGSSVILPEDRLNGVTLTHEIDRILQNLTHYQDRAEKAKSRIIFDAKERLIDELLTLVQPKKTK